MAQSSAKIARRRSANLAFLVFCWVVTAIALVTLGLILWSLVRQGVPGLNLRVFTTDTPAAGSPGGLRNAILGSLFMCALGMGMAISIGLLAGTWLAEYAGNSRYGSLIRFLNDVLLSAPSILIGLFVYVVLVAHVVGHFSALAGGAALGLLAVPLITRTTEDVLKLQPTALRESGIALGTPMWRVILSILWRGSTSGILTGALLAFARISGETAPLLFTSLGAQFLSWSVFQPTASLPVTIFNDALTPYPDLNSLAWTGAFLIAASVLGITILARILSREPRQS